MILVLAVQVTFAQQQRAASGPQEVPNISDPRLQVNLPDVKGDTLTLASFKGKVVLLDFWASWCMPCRAANKKLVKIYSKYRPLGFEIFGVSLDESKKDWMKAIAKDKITWVQVNESGNSWEAKTVQQWAISAIPTSFLVNKKGDIVAMNLEPAELEKALKELLAE
ncbi:MAG: TlpA family protein disulfide reductase [Chitinophagaceae bacterium]|nr:MAG: TlpA family protein disulfide reductase [Chitinophagaceae bacterium]